MHKLLEGLLSCLATPNAPQQDYERWGLSLSLVIEKHSKLRSPEKMYAELLPKSYREIQPTATEYVDLVRRVSEMLRLPTLPTASQNMLVFALGGTDDTTLQWTTPAIVGFLSVQHEEGLQLHAISCLRKMLSEPECIRINAARIRAAIPALSKVRQVIEQSLPKQEERNQAIATLDMLDRLLESSC